MKKLNRQVGLAYALAAALWVPVGLGAAAPQNIPGLAQTGTNQFTVNTNQTNTVQLLEQFMALREQLQTNQDEELRQLVAQMNSAPAEQKVEAVAAIINKLVEQRLAAHASAEYVHLLRLITVPGRQVFGHREIEPKQAHQKQQFREIIEVVSGAGAL